MPKIFISYRRDDSGSEADLIHDYMMRHFGRKNIFLDVESIPVGRNFREYLAEQVAAHDVVLVIIGSNWARIMRERADHENDFVRIELESALEQDKLVIPVLVQGASMPNFADLPASIAELQWLNSTEIRRKPDLEDDCRNLAQGINDYFKIQQQRPRWIYGAGLVSLVLIIGIIGVLLNGFGDGSDKPETTATRTELANVPTNTLTNEPSATATDNPTNTPMDEITVISTETATNAPTDTFTYTDVSSNTTTPTYTSTPSLTPTINLTPTLSLSELRNLVATDVSQNGDWAPHSKTIYGAQMVLVPAGCFRMGNDELAYNVINDEWTQGVPDGGKICFDEPFWLDKYEVINADYDSRGCSDYSSGDEFPRNCVSWIDANAFCTARGARLPTEAEWEYAARGPSNWVYPWGNEFDGTRLNCGLTDCPNDGYANASPIGNYAEGASWVGAMDMAGNVWEWTSTIYRDYPYDKNDGREEIENSDNRVGRGGSFIRSLFLVRAANRNTYNQDDEDKYGGFRCAHDFD